MTIKKNTLVDIIEDATGCTVLKIMKAQETEELGNRVITADVKAAYIEKMTYGKRVEVIKNEFRATFIYIVDTHTLMDDEYRVLA